MGRIISFLLTAFDLAKTASGQGERHPVAGNTGGVGRMFRPPDNSINTSETNKFDAWILRNSRLGGQENLAMQRTIDFATKSRHQ
jgi:hypothetical protein